MVFKSKIAHLQILKSFCHFRLIKIPGATINSESSEGNWWDGLQNLLENLQNQVEGLKDQLIGLKDQLEGQKNQLESLERNPGII